MTTYTVYYYHRKRKRRYDISAITQNISWAGSVDRMHRTAVVTLTSYANIPFDTGEKVRIYKDDTLMFAGRLFKRQRAGTGDVTLTCHDDAYYLYRSETSISKSKITLSELFELCCSRVNLKPGYVKKTKTKYTNLEFVGETLQTILYTVMGMERQRTGRSYYVRAHKGKLELRERGAMKGIDMDAAVIASIDTTKSAENTYTKIKYDVTIDANKGSSASGAAGSKATLGNLGSGNYKGPDLIAGRAGFKGNLKGTDKWNDAMIAVGRQKGIDPLFLKVIMAIESGGDEKALGPILNDGDRARGLFQLVPGRIGTDLDWNRLLEGEYNLSKSVDVMLNEKGGIAKSLGKKMSIAEMARFWVGYSETDYSYTYQTWAKTLYAGFGGDPDSLITTNKSGTAAGTTASKPVKVDMEKRYTLDSPLEKKLGTLISHRKGTFTSQKEFKDTQKRLAKELLREENTVSVKMPGSVYGVSGRKVDFDYYIHGAGGVWYIQSDDHIIDQYGHQMTLNLSDTNEQPEPEYTPPRAKAKASGGASSKAPTGSAASVVDEAMSWVGKIRYVFGGKSIVNGTGDCSGFTKYVYLKAAGLNIGDGTSNQLTKGSRVDYADVQAGDIVFFAGTYRSGVSHVGVVTKKGWMVNLQSYGCKHERYDAGYWKKYLLEVRRVL